MQSFDTRAAGPEQQYQNPVERFIQSIDNQINSVMIDQDLLSPAWWSLETKLVHVSESIQWHVFSLSAAT